MKLHLITVGSPKLEYAKSGWNEYIKRLGRYHQVRVTHLADKHNDADHLLAATGKAPFVALVIGAAEFSSHELADYIEKQAHQTGELCFVVGGPDGLPQEVINKATKTWGFSQLTFPHDLAMVVLAEALYRASTITAGLPYHH